jgi:intracellular sulfur oxidation DsrE/DsrF family protein
MTTRRAFIATAAAIAAAPGIASAASPAPNPSPSEAPLPKLNFELTAFDAILDRDAAHKHLFSSRNLDTGDVFGAVRATLNAYGDVGVPLNAVAPVVVLYHTSIVLGFDDYAYNTYIRRTLQAMRKRHPSDAQNIDDLLSAKSGNPALVKGKAPWDASIPSLVADAGLHVFICNNALDGFAQLIAEETKRHAADVYADLRAHLVPNATIVPAGVWAVHAIQERRYTLLQTS